MSVKHDTWFYDFCGKNGSIQYTRKLTEREIELRKLAKNCNLDSIYKGDLLETLTSDEQQFFIRELLLRITETKRKIQESTEYHNSMQKRMDQIKKEFKKK